MLRRWLLVLSLALLAACGTRVNEENYSHVENGMSRAQVVDLLGQPAESSGASALGISGGESTWRSGKIEIKVQFLNDKVVGKQLIALHPGTAG